MFADTGPAGVRPGFWRSMSRWLPLGYRRPPPAAAAGAAAGVRRSFYPRGTDGKFTPGPLGRTSVGVYLPGSLEA